MRHLLQPKPCQHMCWVEIKHPGGTGGGGTNCGRLQTHRPQPGLLHWGGGGRSFRNSSPQVLRGKSVQVRMGSRAAPWLIPRGLRGEAVPAP